jgi:hypothetical protein
MSVDQWAVITEANSGSDWEICSCRRGGERAASLTDLTVQRLVRAADMVPLPRGRVRVVVGGSSGGGPAAGSAVGGLAAGNMTSEANCAGIDALLHPHLTHHTMPAAEGLEFIRDRRTYQPVLDVSPFGQGPGDIAVFAVIYEIICKITHMLLVGSYFGPQEDLGTMCILSAFTEDTDKMTRTALEDASVSNDRSYHLHTVLRLSSPAGLFTATIGKRVEEAVRGFGLAACLFAQLDGSCSPL